MGRVSNTAAGRLLMMPPQAVHSAKADRGLSRMQALRIRSALADGIGEQSIARGEGVTLRDVVRVRLAELDRLERHKAAVRVLACNLVDKLNTLTGEIDAAVMAELTEAA